MKKPSQPVSSASWASSASTRGSACGPKFGRLMANLIRDFPVYESEISSNGYAFHSSRLVRVSTTAELATRLLYGAGLVATACCARRWNSSPRAPDLRRLNRNVNSSR